MKKGPQLLCWLHSCSNYLLILSVNQQILYSNLTLRSHLPSEAPSKASDMGTQKIRNDLKLSVGTLPSQDCSQEKSGVEG